MKRFPVILLIVFGLALIAFLFFVFWMTMLAKADSLRDFRDTRELEQFLELGKMIILLPDSCKENVDQFIKTASLNGYKAERYRITSPDYYKFWYNEDPYWQPNEAHGVVWVNVAGRTFLIEPSIPMAWELTVGYAGYKTDSSWQ